MQIDHVVWTATDLGATESLLRERYGLEASGGGSHAGHGTHNRIFPLGGGFLEVVAVEDMELARSSPIGCGVLRAPEGLHTWVVAVEDTHAQALRLGLDELTLRRGALEMPLAGVARSFNRDGALPFFIKRSTGHRFLVRKARTAASPRLPSAASRMRWRRGSPAPSCRSSA